MEAQPEKLIATTSRLQYFLASITPGKTIYIDFEGFKLGRNGTISLLTIHIIDGLTLDTSLDSSNAETALAELRDRTGIIDITALQQRAFSTSSNANSTLKDILESPNITKYIWDVRRPANALWYLYNIRLAGVIDIQLLDSFTRESPEKPVRTMASRFYQQVHNVSWMTEAEQDEWIETRDVVEYWADPKIWEKRPLGKEVLKYCVGQVVYLPRLVKALEVNARGRRRVEEESGKRVDRATGEEYDPDAVPDSQSPFGYVR
ncbi:hypothetical protein BT63DRAFT_153460 [Microthyrium microscopicum]|uniref:3'-5' exonuclease domain-containing protein n=1 Tax=Microthyrium microscopicum TaxID=703497 RepID=A0A6A6UQX0_9PEZI|nr:hypothetical protein BT63DRAFT_153460 [Microthyrium microscopicum]